jgi:hypothetical protein
MPRPHRSGIPQPECSEAAPPWADLPNAVLIARLRMPAASESAGEGPCDPRDRRMQIGGAAAELRRRRLPALLDYAVLFTAEASAQALALEALQRAVRDIRTAPGSDQPPPHYPFLLVEWTARLWAGSARRRELSADFLARLDRTTRISPARPTPEQACVSVGPVARSYHRLTPRARAVLWHAVVERDDALTAGRSLGVHPDRVPHLGRSALEDLRRSYLRLYAERPDNSYCRRYSSLLEASTRRRGAYSSDDLDRHVAVCCDCARAYTVLAGMNKWPGAVLATALLPWGGTAFAIVRRHRTTVAATGPGEPLPGTVGTPPRTHAAPGRPWLRHVAHRSPAVAVTAAVGLLAAATAALNLPVNDHTTDASGPVSADSPRPSPRPSAPPTPAYGTAPARSDGTKLRARSSDAEHPAGANDGACGQPSGRTHANVPPQRSTAHPRRAASADGHSQARTGPELTGLPPGLSRDVEDLLLRSIRRGTAGTAKHLIVEFEFGYRTQLPATPPSCTQEGK